MGIPNIPKVFYGGQVETSKITTLTKCNILVFEDCGVGISQYVQDLAKQPSANHWRLLDIVCGYIHTIYAAWSGSTVRILHRDISSGNLMVRANHAMVIDWEYALQVSTSERRQCVSSHPLTGTLVYASMGVLSGGNMRSAIDDIESLFYVLAHAIETAQYASNEYNAKTQDKSMQNLWNGSISETQLIEERIKWFSSSECYKSRLSEKCPYFWRDFLLSMYSILDIGRHTVASGVIIRSTSVEEYVRQLVLALFPVLDKYGTEAKHFTQLTDSSILGFNFTPFNSDDDTKIDGALAVCSPQDNVKGQPDPNYRNIFAIVEFKRNSTSRMDPFGQLIDYTRNLYANQLNRRFAWVLSVCGTNVHACLFHHGGVRASTAMDLATSAGRKDFVSLLVNWSLCETPKLGYGPSVRIDPAMHGENLEKFNEIKHLKLIDERLRNNSKGVLYSKIVMAGTVRIKHGQKEILDEAFAIFADDSTKEYGCRRNHQRIVLDMYGEHLKTLKNESKLIMVLADAMFCHNTILEKCKLLHQDISDNNILVVRNSHNESSTRTKDLQGSFAKDSSTCPPVRGLLIDFDYAALVEPDSGCSGRDHRSGTLPFMSIHNLSGESGRQTALDDWESSLYLACWLGTFGITRKDRRKTVVHENAPIREWRNWNMSTAADPKRTSMHSRDIFLAHTVKHMNEKYPLLRDFVIEIHKRLFLYKKDCSGSLVIFDDPLATAERQKRGLSSSSRLFDKPAPSFSLNHEQQPGGGTPQKQRVSHASSKGNLTLSNSEIRTERNAEAKVCVEQSLVSDTPVAQIIRPRDTGLSELVSTVATSVNERLEAFTTSAEQSNEYTALKEWVSGQKMVSERALYPCISAFFSYVSQQIDTAHKELVSISTDNNNSNIGSYSRARLLLPAEMPDSNPDGSDDHTRVDIALMNISRKKEGSDSEHIYPGKPDYKHVAAIVEIKHRSGKGKDALAQLYTYNRNLYTNQVNRRFTWGFTICGTVVHACVFSNDNIFMSKSMDVNSTNGRSCLVTMLVDMAYCEEDQLGYDPTIRLDDHGNAAHIDVYDRGTSRKYTLRILKTIMRATRSFGRHTRCFLCRDDVLAENVVVKDAWAHSNRRTDSVKQQEKDGDLRDEVVFMQKIRDCLAGRDDLKGTFASITHGGAVQILRHNSTLEDNTDTVFGELVQHPPNQCEFRVHRRIAMKPECVPLQNIENVDQLIVVVADVMAAHTAIATECRLLHRDISVNNMLFTKLPDNTVRGVLIDFDCAKDMTDNDFGTRPERTGTYPYMSINNLADSNVKRTQLDDWESLIYVLCWLGTTGINLNDEKQLNPNEQLPISDWQGSDPKRVARSKRHHLQSWSGFVGDILNGFLDIEGYFELSGLVEDLYNKLFHNEKLSVLASGTTNVIRIRGSPENAIKGRLDEKLGTKIRNPFERRAEYSADIANDLLEAIMTARTKALTSVIDWPQLPKFWCSWIYWLSPYLYYIEGVITSDLYNSKVVYRSNGFYDLELGLQRVCWRLGLRCHRQH
ncbi:hypothetical protein IWW48_005525 [Coemansia sp. RSA 1200]|nr:hypothetical protein IWW48_005525 [Coemansia sp. RSA 1200]